MKTLIAFYTRTGTTRNLAEAIKKELNADIDEIIDAKDRKGPIGWLTSGRDAMKKYLTEISYNKQPEKYDVVIIGSPVWAGTITPAVRTYMTKNKVRNVAFFFTSGSGNAKKAVEDVETLAKKKPLAVISTKYKEKPDLEGFVSKIKKG